MKEINSIINSVLKETLKERAKKITETIMENIDAVCEECGGQLSEGECTECGYMKEEMFEEDNSSACSSYEYHKGRFGEDNERTQFFKDKCEGSSSLSVDSEIDEELHGGQHKLDVAEPKGKLTSADFKKLRSRKGKKSEENENWGAVARVAVPMVASYIGSKMGENNESERETDELGEGLKDLGRKIKSVGANMIGIPTYDHRDEKGEWKKDREGKDYDMFRYPERQGADELDYEMEQARKQGLKSFNLHGKTHQVDQDEEFNEEFFYSDDEDSERASKEEPTYVGRGLSDNKAKADTANKILGSFDDEHGWYDEMDRKYVGDFNFDFEEEEFPDFDSLMNKYGDKQRWFDRKGGKKFFDTYQKKYGGSPFKVRKRTEMEEEDTQEGNAFTGALAKAREEGDDEFSVGGKRFETKEGKDKKFIQKATEKMKKKGTEGSFKKYCGGEVTKSCIDKAMKSGDPELVKKANFAKNIKAYKGATHESVNSNLKLTESELIDLIESIILEEKEKKVLDKKKPKGYTEYEKNVKLSKKENDDYIKSVTKKLKDYLKDGSKDDFSFDPKHFPKGNGQLEKMKKKAYTPSEAVEEYIEEFAYSPGMENLQYDEVKPNDDWIEMNLEGNSKTGNSSDYANAEKTELGKKINEKRKKNLYGIEKRKNSYNRVKQPIDSAGEGSGEKSIKNMFKKLEENSNSKNEQIIKEEFEKISNLISYNRKTQ